MLVYQISYYTAGDGYETRNVEADTLADAVEILKNDPQAPLAVMDKFETIQESKP